MIYLVTWYDRTVKNVFLGKPGGRRKAETPKLRWLDCTENDLKSMGVKRWRKKAEDRSVWAIILKEALVKLLLYAEEEVLLIARFLHALVFLIN
jgi:hypothetical protein